MRRAVVNDIKLAKKMIEYFDNKAGLWKEEPVSMEPSDDQSDSDQVHRVCTFMCMCVYVQCHTSVWNAHFVICMYRYI